jgi:hypothetical protein
MVIEITSTVLHEILHASYNHNKKLNVWQVMKLLKIGFLQIEIKHKNHRQLSMYENNGPESEF